MIMVAVKGMKMPKNCIECLLFDDEYGDCNVYGESKADMTKGRAENCPLVEIVTCEHCKYYVTDDGNPYCASTGTLTDKDFYCADGERKE